MYYRIVIHQLGLLLVLLSAVLLLIAGLSFMLEYQMERHVSRDAAVALAVVGVCGILVGAAIRQFVRAADQQLGRREAMLLVALTWIGGAAFAALPFFIWALLVGEAQPAHPFHNFANCYFEAMSGLTTTGATVVADVESMPRSLLLWRASLHWLGGLGIVVLFVAVLPSLGVIGKKLYRVEAGTSRQGLQPQIRDAVRTLWYVYLAFTIAQVLLLWLFGMTFFDAICHSFATLATGGFSTRNEGFGAYVGSDAILIVTIVFMFLGSLNFGLYNHLLHRRFRLVWADVETRFFLVILLSGIVVAALALMVAGDAMTVIGTNGAVEPHAWPALLHSAFTVTTIESTTGFATVDFNLWPFLAKTIIVIVMFVGGCSGSTAGGIKVIRIWIVLRVLLSEIERVFRPQVIRPVRIGGSVVDPELKLSAMAYVIGSLFIIGVSAVAVQLFEDAAATECSFAAASSAALTCFCNTGPGLDRVGPAFNFEWMSDASTMLLSLVMLLGRLEIFAIVVLFTPRFWRNV